MHRQLPLGSDGFQIKLLKVNKSPVAERIKNLSKAEENKHVSFMSERERDCTVRFSYCGRKMVETFNKHFRIIDLNICLTPHNQSLLSIIYSLNII